MKKENQPCIKQLFGAIRIEYIKKLVIGTVLFKNNKKLKSIFFNFEMIKEISYNLCNKQIMIQV